MKKIGNRKLQQKFTYTTLTITLSKQANSKQAKTTSTNKI